METIRNYLEAMFSQLPDTSEVRRAKDEMLQMMEDRYSGLVAGGMKENEAVGTVITEFGDIDELRESLGIGDADRSGMGAAFGTAEERHKDPVPPFSHQTSERPRRTETSYDEKKGKQKPVYPNLACEIFMRFFWETVVCIYLIWSFLTFDWWISWIIWPIAAIVYGVLEKSLEIYTERKQEEETIR